MLELLLPVELYLVPGGTRYRCIFTIRADRAVQSGFAVASLFLDPEHADPQHHEQSGCEDLISCYAEGAAVMAS